MAENYCTATVVVRNSQGLHMRPVNLLVQAASKYRCEIIVERAAQRVDCRSYLAMLGLGAMAGEELKVEANGDDAEAAINEIVALFERRFDEDDANDG